MTNPKPFEAGAKSNAAICADTTLVVTPTTDIICSDYSRGIIGNRHEQREALFLCGVQVSTFESTASALPTQPPFPPSSCLAEVVGANNQVIVGFETRRALHLTGRNMYGLRSTVLCMYVLRTRTRRLPHLSTGFSQAARYSKFFILFLKLSIFIYFFYFIFIFIFIIFFFRFAWHSATGGRPSAYIQEQFNDAGLPTVSPQPMKPWSPRPCFERNPSVVASYDGRKAS